MSTMKILAPDGTTVDITAAASLEIGDRVCVKGTAHGDFVGHVIQITNNTSETMTITDPRQFEKLKVLKGLGT